MPTMQFTKSRKIPLCQHCKHEMVVNKYHKSVRGVEIFTFACYRCGTARVNSYRA